MAVSVFLLITVHYFLRLLFIVAMARIAAVICAGGVDDKIAEIIAACNDNSTRYVFALSRFVLGAAVKKRSVSCVAILNYDGAEVPFDFV